MATIGTMEPAGGISRRAVATGIVTALVGYGSSVTVVVNGLTAVGASTAQAASGLLALGVTMGVTAILLSLVHRMPISIAWSTPGAALLVTTGPVAGGFAAAEGAFAVAGFLVVVAGLALLGAFGTAVSAALKDEGDRTAALVTFLLTASGLSFFGIGSAFWGLIGGLAVLSLRRLDFSARS